MLEAKPLKILVPLDGSALSEAVLPALTPMLRILPSEVTLLHVAEALEEADRAGAAIERARLELLNAGVPVAVRAEWGEPAPEILRESLRAFDLIAMSTHGRTGVRRMLLGSVAEEVVRQASIPVLLCRPDSRVGDWKRILVALDGTPGAEEILRDVHRLAKALKPTLYLLRVSLSLIRATGFRGVTMEAETPDPERYLEKIQDGFASEGVLAVPYLREGNAAAGITDAAEEVGAGLICMTTEGRPDVVEGLNASVAAEVIRAAPCPVLVRRQTGVPAGRSSP